MDNTVQCWNSAEVKDETQKVATRTTKNQATVHGCQNIKPPAIKAVSVEVMTGQC